MKKSIFKFFITTVLMVALTDFAIAQELFKVPDGVETRWASFENQEAEKGAGGAANKTAKGHPAEIVAAGETKTLMDMKGAGIIQRIWFTISDRSPEMLRSLKLEMFWDGHPESCSVSATGRLFWFSPGPEGRL